MRKVFIKAKTFYSSIPMSQFDITLAYWDNVDYTRYVTGFYCNWKPKSK